MKNIDRLGKAPRSTLNRLKLLEFCLENGSPRFKETLDGLFDPKEFSNYMGEEQDDLDQPIRNCSKRIWDMILNQEELRQAREKATSLRERITGVNNESLPKPQIETQKPVIANEQTSNNSSLYDGNYKTDLEWKLGLKKPSQIGKKEANETHKAQSSDQGSSQTSKTDYQEVKVVDSSDIKVQHTYKIPPPPTKRGAASTITPSASNPQKQETDLLDLKPETSEAGLLDLGGTKKTPIDLDFTNLSISSSNPAAQNSENLIDFSSKNPVDFISQAPVPPKSRFDNVEIMPVKQVAPAKPIKGIFEDMNPKLFDLSEADLKPQPPIEPPKEKFDINLPAKDPYDFLN